MSNQQHHSKDHMGKRGYKACVARFRLCVRHAQRAGYSPEVVQRNRVKARFFAWIGRNPNYRHIHEAAHLGNTSGMLAIMQEA